MIKTSFISLCILLMSQVATANTFSDSTTSTGPSTISAGSASMSSGAILGIYRYNTSGMYGKTRYKNWTSGMCASVNGDWVMASTSSRRRTGQGTDYTFFCLSK